MSPSSRRVLTIGRSFDRIVVVMFENQYLSYCLENPYLRSLASKGILVASSHGVMHPSQTNYISSLAGELCNVTSDERPSPSLGERLIVDLLEEAGLSWRAYMQSYRRGLTPWKPGFEPQDDYPYVIKHNPFSSFSRITEDEARWAKVGDEADFFADVLDGDLPHFSWFTPNMWNDGHYTTGTQEEPPERAPALVDQLADWLRGFFAKLHFPGPESLLPERTLVVVTFDEADFEKGYTKAMSSTYDGPNQIYTVLLGQHLEPCVEADEGYNHYSLLRTVEQNFGLGDLGKNDAEANWFRFLWGRRFAWGTPNSTMLGTASQLAAVEHRGRLHLATVDEEGAVVVSRLDDLGWVEAARLPGPCTGALALGSNGSFLLVCWRHAAGELTGEGVGGEVASFGLANDAGSSAAIASLQDGRLMVAWEDKERRLWSVVGNGKSWDEAVATGRQTSGGLALARQGAVLHLIFPRGDHLRWQTWNTADYNVVTVKQNKYGGPWDNSSKDAWSACSFPVAHWSSAPDPSTPGESEPTRDPHRGRAPLAAASLDGVVHLVAGAPDDGGLASTTMSIPGLLTPTRPVSYNQDPTNPDYSNGYGTATQAGWSPQRRLEGVHGATALTVARCGDAVALLFGDSEGRVQIVWGADTKSST